MQALKRLQSKWDHQREKILRLNSWYRTEIEGATVNFKCHNTKLTKLTWAIEHGGKFLNKEVIYSIAMIKDCLEEEEMAGTDTNNRPLK
jgi:hypothetical protein